MKSNVFLDSLSFSYSQSLYQTHINTRSNGMHWFFLDSARSIQLNFSHTLSHITRATEARSKRNEMIPVTRSLGHSQSACWLELDCFGDMKKWMKEWMIILETGLFLFVVKSAQHIHAHSEEAEVKHRTMEWKQSGRWFYWDLTENANDCLCISLDGFSFLTHTQAKRLQFSRPLSLPLYLAVCLTHAHTPYISYGKTIMCVLLPLMPSCFFLNDLN